MVTTIEQGAQSALPAVPEIDRQRALEALGIADLLKIDPKLWRDDPMTAANIAFEARRQLDAAVALFESVCRPVAKLITETRQVVRDAIPEGSAMLEHPLLDIKMVAPQNDWRKDPAELLALKDVLKPDEFNDAMPFVGVDLKDNPKAIEAALAAGAKPIYSPHAGVLNRLRDAKHYGPDGAVGKIIAKGLSSVPKGEARLEITLNASAAREMLG